MPEEKTAAQTAREAVDFADLWEYEAHIISLQGFPDFDVDQAPAHCKSPVELYSAIFDEMKSLTCARCGLKGHER